MTPRNNIPTVGVLISGGLDSSILLASLLRQGELVQPFYIRADLAWESAELAALERFLATTDQSRRAPLVVLHLPLGDVYAGHWSLTGRAVPDAASADEAVYLPGRNALLLIKPVLYCQQRGIRRLAMAPLSTSPFADASPAFFQEFLGALNRGVPHPVEIYLPFAAKTKRQVMEEGAGLALEHTFSCLSPVGELHCGDCNKCAERRAAFRQAALVDRTRYASGAGLPKF